MPPLRRRLLVPVAIAVLTVLGSALLGYDPDFDSRETAAYARVAAEVPEYREDGPYLLVCPASAEDFAERNEGVAYNQRIVNEQYWEDECPSEGYASVAEAIAAVEDEPTRILILPGHYTAAETLAVDHTTPGLQIEGLGDGPEDVQIAASPGVGDVMRVDAPTGVYLKGFTLSQGGGSGLRTSGASGTVVEAVAAADNAANGLVIGGDTTVFDCRAEDNGNAGIALPGTVGTVDTCESSGNRIGLRASGDVQLTLTGNRLHGNATGLLVAESVLNSALEATGNAIYDNNAEYRTGPVRSACAPEPADDGGGVLCADLAAPAGVGVAVAGGTGNHFWGNHIWGQQGYAVALWSPLGDAADHNRFEDNTLGVRDDGQRSRNRHDLWWDGAGEANCFTEPTARHPAPADLPGCGTDHSRLVGDPLRTFKVWTCGPEFFEDGTAPGSCDWFGAEFTDRVEVQAGVLFGAALLFMTGIGWFAAARSPVPPAPGRMTFSAIATASGALLAVMATWSGRADHEALAIALWGLGWLLAGRAWSAANLRALGGLTTLVACFALIDAFDRAVWMIPGIPFAPAWLWLALLPLWLIAALAATVKRHPRLDDTPPVERTPATVPVSDSFDW